MCYEIVIFPIRKRHFRVRGWSGAFSEPLGRKKDKTKCSYKICILLHRSNLKFCRLFAKFFAKISGFSRIFAKFKILLNVCEISAKINKILKQICKISEIRRVRKDANLVDFEKCCKMSLSSLS